MNVLVLKPIDSASLARIAVPGEIVDIPIDEESPLFKNRTVVLPDAQLTEKEEQIVSKYEAKNPERPALLTDNDIRRAIAEEDSDGTD